MIEQYWIPKPKEELTIAATYWWASCLDPKAQIEQITIGLIYKIMDDMDKGAIELGGAAKFSITKQM